MPDVSSGVIPIPLNVSARALPDKPKRGYIKSFNITVQKELPGGFTGQVGYVGTRQRDINQIIDANAGQVIGAGNAGRPLFLKFGRTGATGILSNPGWSNYDSLQTSLKRRLAQGVPVNVAYTWSKAFGICCDTLSDNSPRVQALEYFELNEALLPQDRPHNFQTSFVAELPFGAGKPFLSNGGVAAALLGGWQVNGLFSAYSGAPFTVVGRDVARHDGQHPAGGSGERHGRDSWRHRPGQAVVRHDGVPAGDRAAIRNGGLQQHARARDTSIST